MTTGFWAVRTDGGPPVEGPTARRSPGETRRGFLLQQARRCRCAALIWELPLSALPLRPLPLPLLMLPPLGSLLSPASRWSALLRPTAGPRSRRERTTPPEPG